MHLFIQINVNILFSAILILFQKVCLKQSAIGVMMQS